MDNKILLHRTVWEKKKILRDVYCEWYKWIDKDLSFSGGKILEVGSGIGNYKSFKPEILSSDIHSQKWIDVTLDAHLLPFKTASLSNIVLCDTLHHLANPLVFMEEALRVLKTNGRIIMIEPFPSPFSLLVYRKFHPEPFLMHEDYFNIASVPTKNAWDANQAIPYLLFFKRLDKFKKKFSDRVVFIKRKKFSFILYPATGGFENNQLFPSKYFNVLKIFEKILYPLNWFFAFRCYIVIEKS